LNPKSRNEANRNVSVTKIARGIVSGGAAATAKQIAGGIVMVNAGEIVKVVGGGTDKEDVDETVETSAHEIGGTSACRTNGSNRAVNIRRAGNNTTRWKTAAKSMPRQLPTSKKHA
jgi:hypothetical protein